MEDKIYNLDEFDMLEILNKETNFSKIYLAKNKKTNEIVVLKYFIHCNNKKEIAEHIAKEIFMNKYLLDTDITIKIKGVCFDKEKKFIFLILEKGDFSLYHYLKNVDYNMDDFKKIFYELVKILFILHSKGIVHNDIKLENFLFIDKKIKIIDFGLSDFLTYSPYNDIIKNYICTDFTKAPDSRKTYETDIYSLGLTAIHLILKSYFKIDLKYIQNDIVIIKCIRENDIITNILEFDSEYFKERVGSDCYDLIKKMLCFDKESRINIVDIINHTYFNEFGKININNFNKAPEKIKDYNFKYILQIKNFLFPINYIYKYVSYTPIEYFNNMYEVKYKHIQFEKYINQKVYFEQLFNLEKDLEKDLIKCMSYTKIFNIDSYINTIIFLKKESNFNKINKNFITEYFLMIMILYNGLFTYSNGRINYDKFNIMYGINTKNFNFIYLDCIKILYEDLNIYFFYSNLTYYLDQLTYSYEIIDPAYLVNLKIKCIDFFIDLIKNKIIKEINFITLIKYTINNIVATILNKNIIEYNLCPILDCMKLTNDDIQLLS